MSAIGPGAEAALAADAPLRRFAAEFLASPSAALGLAMLALIIVAALLAPWIAPQDPYDLAALDLLDGQLAPGARGAAGTIYWLGTDDQGRDLLSAILYGLRTSLGLGFASAALALALGTVLGLAAAYRGGRLDGLVMRVVDLQLAIPSMLVALILLALLGPGADKILLALVAVQWAYYARTVRAAALAERGREYIAAARCLALGDARIVLHHLLPNCLPPLVVVATVQLAHAIALEATLSFLGLGLPISEPSLGLLVANGFEYMMSGRYWISFFPGLALLAAIMSINLVGDRLRDLLDPRLRA